jgi:uncharacterized protein
MTTMLWKRLDVPGHDACRVEQRDGAWHLEGTAVFRHEGAAARLDYHVACDLAWRSLRGSIRGWLGSRAISNEIARTAAGWTLDGAAVPGLDACQDLDFGFTPATNLLQMRRCALAVGESAEVPAAWLDAGDGALQLLPQHYERRSERTFWYESPTVGYEALLEMAPNDFVALYPTLWQAED